MGQINGLTCPYRALRNDTSRIGVGVEVNAKEAHLGLHLALAFLSSRKEKVKKKWSKVRGKKEESIGWVAFECAAKKS